MKYKDRFIWRRKIIKLYAISVIFSSNWFIKYHTLQIPDASFDLSILYTELKRHDIFSSFLFFFLLECLFLVFTFLKKFVNKQLTNCVCLLNLACNCGITSRYFTNLWWCEGKKKWSFSRELCIWIYICEKHIYYYNS